MLTVRNTLVALICISPFILVWDGLIAQGIVAGVIAFALAITARTLRPGETEFLTSIIPTLIVAAAVPALWLLFQVLPLGVLVHPIWMSAEKALGHPVHGAVSIDPGAGLIALGQYLSMCAVMAVSAAVAVDRQRAEWILFALTAAAAAIALIVLTDDLAFAGVALPPLSRLSAIDCASLGMIIATAACLRAIERYETHRSAPRTAILWISAGGFLALPICLAALVLGARYWTLFATGCGFASLVSVWIIRRLELGPWGTTAIAVPLFGVALLGMMMAYRQPERNASISLAQAESSVAQITLSQRILQDAPLFGTGAGTFAALAPIYREIDDPPSGPVAATTATTFAIELGKPMLWLITLAAAAFSIFLFRASLHRGRDFFYSAMGGSCLIALLFLAFTNAGLLGTATELIFAAALGLAVAQSKSRTAQL